jgi:ABC-type dipeptide/oligopeptide/nickel transport system permease subunit
MQRRSAVFGAVIMLVMIFISIFGPLIAPYNPSFPDYAHVLAPPSWRHLMGTDEFGRDILSRIFWGARLTLSVGFIGAFASAVIGTPVGLATAYFGGWLDDIVMRIVDVILSFPGILLPIGVIAILGPGLQNVIITIIVFGVPVFARIVRGSAIGLRNMEFVEAARAAGATSMRILFRHLLPNLIGPITVQLTLQMASAILTASGLGFLGFGAQPPTPEWGAMLAEGRLFLTTAPWVDIFPGVCIFLAVLGFNMLGDGLNDMLDPRLRR